MIPAKQIRPAPPLVAPLLRTIAGSVRANAGKPAVADDTVSWSYRELWNRVDVLARGLLTSGVRPGESVGIVGENSASYLAAYLAVLRAGCVVVPVNMMLDPRSIRSQLALVGVRTLFAVRIADELREVLAADYRLLDAREPLRGSGRPALPEIRAEDTASIMLTSGSTGLPKGVEHTHASLSHAVAAITAALPFDRSDRSLVFLPMYTCIPEAVLPILCVGGSLEVLPRFDVDRVAEASVRATTFDAVPTVMSRLLESAPLAALAGLRWIQFASEPMPPPLLRSWWEALPAVRTHQFYGMTELLDVSVASHDLLRSEPETVGRAFSTTDLTIDPLPGYADGSGEILAASPCRMRGYYGDPAATAAALTHTGAMRTGDIGRVDERGLLFLTGRRKDIIISGGFNVAPAEIEATVLDHGGVQEVIVVGIPSPRWGETPVVVAVAKTGSGITPEGLLRHCRTALPGFKRPSAAALVPSLPTTGIGKGDKVAVRRLIADGVITLVSV